MSENRDKIVNIAFTKSEKEQIKKLAKESIMTSSEFIRQSVFDKIRRIENPEIYSNNHKVLSSSLLNQIVEIQKKQEKKIELIYKKTEELIGFRDELDKLSNYVKREDLEEQQEMIINLLKTYKELKPKKIVELFGLDLDNVLSILSNKELFKLNIKTGGFRLNEKTK